MTHFKLPARILIYAKLRLRKQSRTRRQISIEIEVETRQCFKNYKSFLDMIAVIAAKMFSNRSVILRKPLSSDCCREIDLNSISKIEAIVKERECEGK